MVQLLTWLWLFDPSVPALSALSARAPQAEFLAPAGPSGSFTVRLTVNLDRVPADRTILEIPNVLHVRLREHDPHDRVRQNYPAYRMPDGSVPVLEATVVLHSGEHPDWQHMTIGAPLALLSSPRGTHRVAIQFTGARWTMYVDGELLDNDFPFGYPHWDGKITWKLDPVYVEEADLYLPAVEPQRVRPQRDRVAPDIQYWTPPGHNAWVGDVVTCYHQGRYHVFYLYDRRHHQSKFGCGAHYFEHLSTEDFATWTEHEAATPLDEQWECIGTGAPFVFDDRLYIGYGLHTTRVYPEERTALPAQWRHLEENDRTGAFDRATTPGVPAGSTYAVSTDGGATFAKSGVMFHPCENPSVYVGDGGRLRMLANYRSKGIWEAESVDGGWRCVSPDFPPGGDCTFYFRWGGYDYIIGGFTGQWMKPADAPDSAYQDVVRDGLDIYDGSCVPSVTEIANGRRLMAAWIPIGGWGGPLVIRELIQLSDGRLGSKWMEELSPATDQPRLVAAHIAEPATVPTDGASFLLTFETEPVDASSGKIGVCLLPAEGEQAACELQVDLGKSRAQVAAGSASGFAERERSLREGGSPHDARDFAIEKLLGVAAPFAVRMVVKDDDKLGGTLVDAEIAGSRTLISYRPGLTVGRMILRVAGVRLRDVMLAPLTVPGA